MCIVRIVHTPRPPCGRRRSNTAPTPSIVELANRMGVGRRTIAARGWSSAVWGSILMTALTDLADNDREWSQLSIDDLIDRLGVSFAEFTGFTTASDSRCDHLATPPRASGANGTTF